MVASEFEPPAVSVTGNSTGRVAIPNNCAGGGGGGGGEPGNGPTYLTLVSQELYREAAPSYYYLSLAGARLATAWSRDRLSLDLISDVMQCMPQARDPSGTSPCCFGGGTV